MKVGDLAVHAWVRSGICMVVGVKQVDETGKGGCVGERLLWVHWIEENEIEACWENELQCLEVIKIKRTFSVLDKTPEQVILYT